MTDKDKKLTVEELKKVSGGTGTGNDMFDGVPYVDYPATQDGPCINPDFREAVPPPNTPFFPPKFE